jgi:hypothetical protein
MDPAKDTRVFDPSRVMKAAKAPWTPGQGMRAESLNNDWRAASEELEAHRESILYRFDRIKPLTLGYFGSGNCKICDRPTTYGSVKYAGVEIPLDMAHYIEFHNHAPTLEELRSIDGAFFETMEQKRQAVRESTLEFQRRVKG